MKPLYLVTTAITVSVAIQLTQISKSEALDSVQADQSSSLATESKPSFESNPTVGSVVDHWDKYCPWHFPDKITCSAQLNSGQQEKIKIEIESSKGCIYGRLLKPAFWHVQVQLAEKEVLSMRSEYDSNNAKLTEPPYIFEKHELFPKEAFNLTISETTILWKKFHVQNRNGICKPHSKLTDDYCNYNEYQISTESLEISNLNCQKD